MKGPGFMTSDEVAAAIEGGVAAELAFAVMVALGSCFEQLADEDQVTIAELYTAARVQRRRRPMLSRPRMGQALSLSENSVHQSRP